MCRVVCGVVAAACVMVVLSHVRAMESGDAHARPFKKHCSEKSFTEEVSEAAASVVLPSTSHASDLSHMRDLPVSDEVECITFSKHINFEKFLDQEQLEDFADISAKTIWVDHNATKKLLRQPQACVGQIKALMQDRRYQFIFELVVSRIDRLQKLLSEGVLPAVITFKDQAISDLLHPDYAALLQHVKSLMASHALTIKGEAAEQIAAQVL
ncbi:MAG: hypothetical protein ACPG7U_00710 [Holosporaceae bacterium]